MPLPAFAEFGDPICEAGEPRAGCENPTVERQTCPLNSGVQSDPWVSLLSGLVCRLRGRICPYPDATMSS